MKRSQQRKTQAKKNCPKEQPVALNLNQILGSFVSVSPSSEEPTLVPSSSQGDAMVKLNVYGFHTINNLAEVFHLGLYHSGVEVFGCEYSYGASPAARCTIFPMRPKDQTSLGHPGQFRFKESIATKVTRFTKAQVLAKVSVQA